jgi:hypothetical protein
MGSTARRLSPWWWAFVVTERLSQLASTLRVGAVFFMETAMKVYNNPLPLIDLGALTQTEARNGAPRRMSERPVAVSFRA